MSCRSMLWTVFVCVALARLVCAKEIRKNEIGFLIGAAITPALGSTSRNDRLEIGRGVTFEGNYARELIAAKVAGLYFEVPLLATPLQDVTASSGLSPANYASIFIVPGLRLELTPGSVLSPWFSIGGGYARFDESALHLDGSPNTSRGTNRGAAQFGGGIDIRTPVKILFPISLRAEVRDLYSGRPIYKGAADGGFQHNLFVSGGFVIRF